MSYDRQIDQVCPHGVLAESLFVDDDSQTVRPIRPISAAGSVRVVLNGQMEVPATGIYRPGSVLSARRGPFTIKAGENDVISLRVGMGALQSVVLPASVDAQIPLLAAILNLNMTGIVFYEEDGRLGVKTDATGPGATLFLHASSTFLSSIGMPVNREYRGVQIVPGWALVGDSARIDTRNIVFDAPLPGFGNYVELDYTTIRTECRRCGGTGMEHDWRYAVNGEVVQAFDEALLIQEVQKIVFTQQGSNPFHDWYGTRILDTIGKKITPSGVLQNLIVSDIQTAFRYWQSVKRQQETSVGQEVTDGEFPLDLVSINLRQSRTDPTVMFVETTIRDRSTKPIVLERGIRFPLPLDFVEPNAARGTIRGSTSDFVLTG